MPSSIYTQQLISRALFWTYTVSIYLLLVSGSGFDLAVHPAWRRDSLQSIATTYPHLGNTSARLLSVHRNWLIVPCTFPDVGFNFRDLRSTCLTRAKAKYENKTKVIFKKWSEGPFFKTITLSTKKPLHFSFLGLNLSFLVIQELILLLYSL